MEKYIMTRRAFLLGCGAVTGSAALCFATARKAALFPGVDPALDDEKNGYLLERRRAQTLEGVITGCDGTAFTVASEEGMPALVTETAFTSVVGMRSKTYGTSGLRKLYADSLFYSEVPHGHGSTLETTVHPGWQRWGYELLDGFRGSCVLVDVDSGAVRILAERPSENLEFELNNLSEKMEKFNKEPDFWYPPATTCSLQPGSTQKIVDAAAILASGMDTHYTDTGQEGAIKNAGNAVYGAVDLTEALKHSINTYFAAKAPQVGKELYEETVDSFFFNHTIELDWGTTLAPQLIFDPENLSSWQQLAIGQGPIKTCPLAITLNIGAVLHPDGAMLTPYLVQRITTESGKVTYENSGVEVLSVPLADAGVREALASMLEATAEGYGLRFPGARVLAKTGTATIQGSDKNNVFLSFSVETKDGKHYAGCFSREKVSGTSSQLKPIAKKLIEKILEEEKKE